MQALDQVLCIAICNHGYSPVRKVTPPPDTHPLENSGHWPKEPVMEVAEPRLESRSLWPPDNALSTAPSTDSILPWVFEHHIATGETSLFLTLTLAWTKVNLEDINKWRGSESIRHPAPHGLSAHPDLEHCIRQHLGGTWYFQSGIQDFQPQWYIEDETECSPVSTL